jgi:hypothetical protein
MNIAAIVQAGGHSAAGRLAEIATQKLREEHPHMEPWTIGELCMVRCAPDGSRFVQFRRSVSGREPASEEIWLTSILESPGRTARIDVLPPENVVR